MKILVVVSGNHGQVAPFVVEQAEALRQAGCDVQMFKVEGHGILGYLRNLRVLKTQIQEFSPDVVHAHYGLCGLLCTLQRKVLVVVTYHGSDINNRRILPLSRIAMRRAAHNIFVSKKLMQKAGNPRHSIVIPCGVDTAVFRPMQRDDACRTMQLNPAQRYVLFAGAFDNEVKNPQLAKDACALLPEITLLELKGYNRTEVAMLMNAVDCLLMTSHSEGSPQVVKEALATDLPIVSVDVGDVASLIDGTDFGAVTERSPKALATALTSFLDHPSRTNGRDLIVRKKFYNTAIAQSLLSIYAKQIR